MKPKEQPGRGGLVSLRLFVAGVICLFIPFLLLGASGPEWWYNPTVTVSGTAPVISGNAQDYAVVNQGQVKNFAAAAIKELNTALASVGGAGSVLNSLAASLTATSGSTNDYAVINLGQLKALAKPFYDRLFAIDYSGPPLTSSTYPWIAGANPAVDYAIANIGQTKELLSFDLTYSSDGNSLPNWWRMYFFGTLAVSSTNTVWVSGTDITYLQAYEENRSPLPEPPVITLTVPPDAVLIP